MNPLIYYAVRVFVTMLPEELVKVPFKRRELLRIVEIDRGKSGLHGLHELRVAVRRIECKVRVLPPFFNSLSVFLLLCVLSFSLLLLLLFSLIFSHDCLAPGTCMC